MSGEPESDDRERRLDEAAAAYLRLRASGQPFDRKQWLAAQYPDLECELAEFLSDLSLLPAVRTHAPSASSYETGLHATGSHTTGLHETVNLETPGVGFETSDSNAQETDFVPTRIQPSKASQRYRLQSVLGAGGMGEVWLANDSIVGRQIAVKKIRNVGADRNPDVEARFLFESQVMGRLEHPCIVPLHDFGRDDAGDLYSVMKLVKGKSFKQRISEFHETKDNEEQSYDVELRRLLEIFVRICHAVAYAHSRGILHRDIKPDNIMLGSYSEAMLLDWGLAKAMGEPEACGKLRGENDAVRPPSGNSRETRAGAMLGSPVYMAPEVAAGNTDLVDERTDVYLLGATLYELMTGRPPRAGKSVLEIVELARRVMPPPPRSIDRRIPKPLEAICTQAMALDRDRRYAGAVELASDLEQFLAGEPVSAYPEPALQRVWRWSRRHRRGLLRTLVGLFLLAIIGFAIANAVRTRQLEEREIARDQLSEFRRLADEAQFFAANTDPLSEQAPYYDPQQALRYCDRTLRLASAWGRDGQGLPLREEREAYGNELHTLLLLSANLYQQSSASRESQLAAIDLLDQVALPRRGDSRSYHEIRERCLRQLGYMEEADREAERAKDRTPVRTALDWFLEGERLRQKSSEITSGVKRSEFLARVPTDSSLIGEAISAFQESIQLDPTNYWARYQLARSYLKLQRGPEAVEALGACIAIRPDAPWAYSTRGLVRGLMGEFELAEEDLKRALEVAPGFRPAHLNRGLVAFLNGRDQDALNELDLALAPPKGAELIEAAIYRAQVHLRQGDLLAAQLDCDRFLEDRPNFSPARLLDAKLHFLQGDDDAGMRSISEYVRLTNGRAFNPDDMEAKVGRAKVLRKLAVSLDPVTQRRVLALALKEYETVDNPIRSVEVTAIKDLLGLSSEVIDQYTQQLATAPHDIATRNMRGLNYVKLEQYELAADDFRASIQLSPQDAEAHTLLGYVMALQGQETTAELAAAKSVLYGGHDFLTLHNTACIYAQLARAGSSQRVEYENTALAVLEKAIKLFRQNPNGIDLIEIIRNEVAFESLKERKEFQKLLE